MSSHIRQIVSLVALLSCAIVATAAAATDTGQATTKQRVSFLGTFDTNTGAGKWKLIPITAGPLKADSGTLSGNGRVVGRPLRNGQRVTLITGGDSLVGKLGAFGISQSVVSTEVGPYSADVGTWQFRGGTGAYEDVTGGGRFAAVGLASGVLHVNQEGWLTIG